VVIPFLARGPLPARLFAKILVPSFYDFDHETRRLALQGTRQPVQAEVVANAPLVGN